MRAVATAFFLTLFLLACSPEERSQVQQPEAPAAVGYHLTFTSAAQLALPEGSPIRVTPAAAGLRLQGHAPSANSNLRTDGASVALGADNEAAFSGNVVRVIFRARGVDGADSFEAAYSTNGSGNSGWREIAVTEQMSDVGFDFTVPPVRDPLDDFIGVNPPTVGAIEIESVRVELVSPTPAASGDGSLRP